MSPTKMRPVNIAGTTRESVDIGRTRISYQKRGSGPSLVFIHGWPLNGNTWRNVVPRLEGFTSYAIDLPGCGATAATDQTPLSVRGHADAVVGFIDALGLDEVVLIGQDSGGMVCRYVAQKRPNAVQSLVLIGTEIPGVHSPLVKLFALMAKLPGVKAMFRLAMGNKLLAKSPLSLGGTVHDTTFLDGEFRTAVIEPVLADDVAMDAAVAMIRHFSFDDIDALADVHAELTMPALLIFGEDDGFFPVDKAEQMQSQFGGPTEFVRVPKAKLLVHEEYPEKIADLTKAFLANATSDAS